MPKIHYDWKNGPAQLEQHSVAKHNLLRSYLVEYFKTLTNLPQQDELRLTIVDGFAGGGEYTHKTSGDLMLGSPFICLNAAEEAEAVINGSHRIKKIRFNVDYIFVEKNPDATKYLDDALRRRGFAERMKQDIHLFNGDFNQHANDIIEKVRKKTPRIGRAIFILDQYGYSDVPMPLLAKIFKELPRAEVILTFNVGAFMSFATDKNAVSPLHKIGLDTNFGGKTFEEIKMSETSWRAFIQSQLYPRLVQATGAAYHTPFFIRSEKGHGDFWLVHLSMHQKARDVMTEVHWLHQNADFAHYGGEGYGMDSLGYIASADERYTQQGLFTFDVNAQKRTETQLYEDIPKLIYAHEDGMLLETLLGTTCNNTPATARIQRNVLSKLAQEKEIEIVGQDGARRRSANSIVATDRIMAPQQFSFLSSIKIKE